LLGGCNSEDPPPGPAEATRPALVAKAAESCLKEAEFATTRGRRSPGDTDAPDVEVTASKAGTIAFIGFYKDPSRAQDLEPSLRRNARRFGGRVERRGAVTVIARSTGKASPTDVREVRNCAF